LTLPAPACRPCQYYRGEVYLGYACFTHLLFTIVRLGVAPGVAHQILHQKTFLVGFSWSAEAALEQVMASEGLLLLGFLLTRLGRMAWER
jgi:hypothetical protein